jgi:hypothetical protein
MEGSSEHSNEPSDSMKGRGFLDQMSNYEHLNKDSVPWSHLKFSILNKSQIKLY